MNTPRYRTIVYRVAETPGSGTSVLSEQPPIAEQAADYRPQIYTGTPAINTSETTKLYS